MDILQQSKLRSLVIENLISIGGKQRGDQIWLNCPWHSETKPSLSVHVGHKIIPGSFRCFGCPARGGWNVLARMLSLPSFDFKKEDKVEDENMPLDSILKDLKEKIALNEAEYKILKGTEDLADDFTWRGYGKKFYEKLGGKFYWNRTFDRNYLHFPLYMNKIYMGYTLCNLDGKDIKYQTITDSSKVFFLYDYIPHGVPIVLVEGHFDALRLYAEGFFPLGLFGLQNWSEIKKNYLVTKAPPKIVIAFDGDKPGYESAINIFKDLRLSCNVDIFYLPIYDDKKYKIDPGNMPEEFLHALRRKIDE